MGYNEYINIFSLICEFALEEMYRNLKYLLLYLSGMVTVSYFIFYDVAWTSRVIFYTISIYCFMSFMLPIGLLFVGIVMSRRND